MVGSLTLVHPVEDCLQHLVAVAIAVLLPHGAVLTPQDHQLPVPPAQSREVRDLHYHRPATHTHTHTPIYINYYFK